MTSTPTTTDAASVDTRPNLHGLLPEDLVEVLHRAGVDAGVGEARRILAHAVARGSAGFPDKRPVARHVTQAVDALTQRAHLDVVERADDPADGFSKLLLRSPDGALSEAVLIPLERPGRYTVCLSTQVGCAMGCAFCATGRLRLVRHLAAWEMVSAWMRAREEAPGRVTGAVLMGQGEPLHNYNAVIQAASILAHPCGGRVRAESISVSTVGLVPQIRRYTREGHRFRLIVSLTSAIDERRRELLPITRRYGLADLAQAIREHARARAERATVAWVVLGGVNTGDDEVRALAQLLGDVPLRVNLIDVNDPRPDGFRRATPEELSAFRDGLRRLGVPVVRRYSGGASRHAACGMLASKRCHALD